MLAKIEGKINQLSKFEPAYFYFFLALNLIPVLIFRYFPTVDGPAHLYNANLIVELLGNPESILHNFYAFNKGINPNWTGHFFLCLFLAVFPAYIAEKLILLIYLIGLPLGLRHLFKTLDIRNMYMVYMIFPFTYSYLFFFGFYNFNLALVFFIFGISFWIKYWDKITLKRCIILFTFSSLICLSHIFVFAVFLLSIFILNCEKILFGKGNPLALVIKNLGLQIICLSLGIVLLLSFIFFSANTLSSYTYIQQGLILQFILDSMPVKGINYGKAGNFAKWVTYVFAALITYILVAKIIGRKKYVVKNYPWLIITLCTLIMAFFMPDGTGIAGFITTRLILLFFIFLLIWIASQEVKIWMKIVCFGIINYISVSLIIHNVSSIAKESRIAAEIHEVSEKIEDNSVVLPVIFSNDFLHVHISNYLGTDKPVIILENYEALLHYFPLKWNDEKTPELFQDPAWYGSACAPKEFLTHQGKIIDYVFVLNDPGSTVDSNCKNEVDVILNESFQKVYEGKYGLQLYKKL